MPPALATALPRAAPSRQPRVPQLIRHPSFDFALTAIDWSAWYLTAEDDMGESWLHSKISDLFEGLLTRWLAERGDTRSQVGRNVFFQWVEAHPLVQMSPDAFVVATAPTPLPKSVQTWLPGHLPPRFALEVVSDDWHKGYHDNPAKYAQMGCAELVIYDPEHNAHRKSKDRAALQVYRRTADGLFVRSYVGPGPAPSAELHAWLVVAADGSRMLRLARDADGTDLLPTAEEALAAADAENARLRAQLAQMAARADND